MQCQICGQQIGSGYFTRAWNDPHYKTYHDEYSRWLRGWTRIFTIVGIIELSILVYALYISYNDWSAAGIEARFAPPLLYTVSVSILLIWYFIKAASFKREWKDQHPARPSS